MTLHGVHRRAAVALAFLVLTTAAVSAVPAGIDGADGNAFATAIPIAPEGRYEGRLDPDDNPDDYYKFPLTEGDSVSIDVYVDLVTGALQGSDAHRRPGVRLYDPHGILLDTPNSNPGDARVGLVSAPVTGDYRLHFNWDFLQVQDYGFCFAQAGDPCVSYGLHPIDLLWPLPKAHANVLLVPPAHGNPFGPETAKDYLDATLAGIRQWAPVFERFADDYPQFDYLTGITVHVEVFDGEPQRAGYDVIVAWAPYTGPLFRGVASAPFGPGALYEPVCYHSGQCDAYYDWEPYVSDGGRVIVLGSFANSPRAGQMYPDWPEATDVYNVVLHEFAHTWGLGHTDTWTEAHGPDLMVSPYSDVFGTGDLLGDGGWRSPTYCISSLDLYGMARLYAWIPDGAYDGAFPPSAVGLPSWMPYELYC